MNLADIILQVAYNSGQSKEVTAKVLSNFVETIEREMRTEGKIRIPRLGTFKVHTRKSRFGRNPATGVQIVVPEKKVVKFKPLFEV